MRYINTKTKAVIETACVIHGEDWEELTQPKGETKEELQEEQPKEETKRKSKNK